MRLAEVLRNGKTVVVGKIKGTGSVLKIKFRICLHKFEDGKSVGGAIDTSMDIDFRPIPLCTAGGFTGVSTLAPQLHSRKFYDIINPWL